MFTAFNCVNKWFKVNLLPINVDKTHYIQFKTKNKPTLDIKIVCNDNLITTLPKTKFLGVCMYIYSPYSKLEFPYCIYYPKTEFSMLHDEEY